MLHAPANSIEQDLGRPARLSTTANFKLRLLLLLDYLPTIGMELELDSPRLETRQAKLRLRFSAARSCFRFAAAGSRLPSRSHRARQAAVDSETLAGDVRRRARDEESDGRGNFLAGAVPLHRHPLPTFLCRGEAVDQPGRTLFIRMFSLA